eukprot:Protomagalhaensia_sp_Gyna_25__1252@NODE_1625_length_1679_cov_83_198171_g1289_i1_p1_GENE_NODE_1625_length_1679_cov_83_198171_g1289_i1NODE_1625_length_1679_cov_83_198171_g1289_i1_p1_ORF_typecomplete_len444_score40_26Aa_trans/PF01490_18/9_5e42Trp_Tyr_perm/PF03222_13/0_0049_NODE_1625_length_1679_cov_83_198171_g1289_i1961427
MMNLSGKERSLGTQMALSAIGPGLLTLPYGMSVTGFGLGAFFLAAFVTLSAYVVVLIYQANNKSIKAGTYAELVEQVLGHKWKLFMELIVIINGLGVCISFMIFLGGFAPPAMVSLVAFINPNYIPPTDLGPLRTHCLLFFSVVTAALSSFKDFTGLAWLNLVPVAGLSYTTVFLTLRVLLGVANGSIDLPSSSQALLFPPQSFNMFLTPNIFLFTTMMHVNVLPILAGFSSVTRSELVNALKLGHGTLFSFYLTIAVVGFLSAFNGSSVAQNFTMNLPIQDVTVALLRAVLVVTLLSIAPYQFVSVCNIMLGLRLQRRSLEDRETDTYMSLTDATPSLSDQTTAPSIDSSSSLDPADGFSLTARFAASVALVGIALVVALRTDKVATLLSLIGGIGSTTLMCTAPFFITRKSNPRNKMVWVLALTAFVGYSTTLLAVFDLAY